MSLLSHRVARPDLVPFNPRTMGPSTVRTLLEAQRDHLLRRRCREVAEHLVVAGGLGLFLVARWPDLLGPGVRGLLVGGWEFLLACLLGFIALESEGRRNLAKVIAELDSAEASSSNPA
jgi:hypothetical protein